MLALMLAGSALFDASSRAMGKNWAVMAQIRADQTLVENAPFAYVRNPIYVALFLFIIAIAIAFGHARNLPFAIPVYAVATWMRVRREEQLFRNQFGAAYDDYCARGKRFVPGLFQVENSYQPLFWGKRSLLLHPAKAGPISRACGKLRR